MNKYGNKIKHRDEAEPRINCEQKKKHKRINGLKFKKFKIFTEISQFQIVLIVSNKKKLMIIKPIAIVAYWSSPIKP